MNMRSILLGFSIMSCAVWPAYGDDTDIFFGTSTVDNNAKPNVLFILDNSTSMRGELNGAGISKIEALRRSMATILSNTRGVNAGLMQFNEPGGAVVFPIRDLDAVDMNPLMMRRMVAGSGFDGQERLQPRVLSGSVVINQAVNSSFPVGEVSLTGNRLTLGPQPRDTISMTIPVSVLTDDAEEREDGSISLDGLSFDIRDGQVNALRFRDINLPAGAEIESAFVEFTPRANATGAAVVRFQAQSGGAEPLTANTSDISARVRTNNSVDWTVPAWTNGLPVRSPDLSGVVQEALNSQAIGNNVVIIQSHLNGAARAAFTAENGPALAPRLVVSYRDPTSPVNDHLVGLRFGNINIPRGAKVTKAFMTFVPASTTAVTQPVETVIRAGANIVDTEFPSGNNSLSSIAKSTESVSWSIGPWVNGQIEQTPPLDSLVQDIVDRDEWCGGRTMTFFVEPDQDANALNMSGSRVAGSADAGPGLEPKLVVEYSPDPNLRTPGVESCSLVTLASTIEEETNDATQSFTGFTTTGDDTLTFGGFIGGGLVGFRFEDLPIQQGATVAELSLLVTSVGEATDTVNVGLALENNTSAAAFSSDFNNISTRPLSTLGASTLTPWVDGGRYRIPIANVTAFNNLLADTNWDPDDNAVVFRLFGAGSSDTRMISSFEGDSRFRPVLEIVLREQDVDDAVDSDDLGIKVRQRVGATAENLNAEINATPLVDTLYEAALYFGGRDVDWGLTRQNPLARSNTDARHKRVSVPESLTDGSRLLPENCTEDNLSSPNCRDTVLTAGSTYESPITNACQRNFIVLLSDGQANSPNSENRIESLINQQCDDSINNRDAEICGAEISNFLATRDQNASVANNNVVNTFTIAYGLNRNENSDRRAIRFLQDIAEKGNGRAFEAGSEADLTNAFNAVLSEALNDSFSFVVPGTTVSQFNRTTNFEDVFFSVFKPELTAAWGGNLKKYKFGSDPNRADTLGEIVDQNGNLAVDEMTGFFSDNARSFFSDSVDGSDVTAGGAALKLPSDNSQRNVFAYYAGADKDLQNNPFVSTNAAITAAMLGEPGMDSVRRSNVITWNRGQEVSGRDLNNDGDITDARFFVGDPLHSEPVAIQYDVINPGAPNARPVFKVFYATNEGYLHAVDGQDGTEHFAFVPEAVMKNFPTLFDNAVGSHPYGLDGSITPWVRDVDGDGVIEPGDDDHVYLYFGMRRGGNFLYALDVTDIDEPKLLWQLDGGSEPFGDFGQTWSKPTKARVAVNEGGTPVVKDVIIVGAGYDTANDDKTTRSPDNRGNAIYMVDAESPGINEVTPDLVWSASNTGTQHSQLFPEMLYSFPSQIVAGDTTGDTLANVLFAADLGGQVWRFDVNNGAAPSALVDGGVEANLALDDDPANYRRFYGGIDPAVTLLNGNQFFTLSLGSGWRANPLDSTVTDRFYSLRVPFNNSERVYGDRSTGLPLTDDDLVDATDNLVQSTDMDVARNARAELLNPATRGFYVTLNGIGGPNSGEKVLSASITAAAQVFFTTYEPTAETQACTGVVGRGRLYGLSLFDARALFFDTNGIPTRSLDLASGTIPPSPSLIVLPDRDKLLVGPEDRDPPPNARVRRVFWFNDELADGSVLDEDDLPPEEEEE